jgi:hypothetical protein
MVATRTEEFLGKLNGEHLWEVSNDGDEWEEVLPAFDEAPWPELAPEAYQGLAGDVVRLFDPTSEADPVAVLVTFATMFGNASGRGPWFPVGTGSQRTNVFSALAGDTGQGRKGTSSEGPELIMAAADPTWSEQRVQGGLSTGEGVINAIRDASPAYAAGDKDADDGVSDKRLLLIEEELSQGLKTAQRQGNTVSEITRKAWDSKRYLRTMTKGNPSKATDPHISILGHITPTELRKLVGETEIANGFANRFSWYRVRRSKFVADPPDVRFTLAREIDELARDVRRALEFAKEPRPFKRDAHASSLWREVYPELSQTAPGLSGELTARGPQMVIRHFLIYALLDCSTCIRTEHVLAAVALWEYAQSSVTSIFGELTGDSVADRILSLLRASGTMTQSEISDALGRNQSAARLASALQLLHSSGRIIAKRPKQTGQRGRPATWYEIARKGES